MAKVPYKDTVQAINDLAEGRIHAFVGAYAIMRPRVQAGKVKVIALTNRQHAQALTGYSDRCRSGLQIARVRRSCWPAWAARMPQRFATALQRTSRHRRRSGHREQLGRNRASRQSGNAGRIHRSARRSARHRGGIGSWVSRRRSEPAQSSRLAARVAAMEHIPYP